MPSRVIIYIYILFVFRCSDEVKFIWKTNPGPGGNWEIDDVRQISCLIAKKWRRRYVSFSHQVACSLLQPIQLPSWLCVFFPSGCSQYGTDYSVAKLALSFDLVTSCSCHVMAFWLASFTDGLRMTMGDGSRNNMMLPASPFLCQRLDATAQSKVHDKVLGAFGAKRNLQHFQHTESSLRGLVQVSAGSLGALPEWQSEFSQELLVQRHLFSHTGGSYSFRIVNARSTESIEVCPLPIGKAFRDLTRRAVDLDLDLSARVLSRSLKRPLAMVHWKGLAGNVRMKNEDQAINFEWTTLQEPLASGAVDDGAYPTLEDSDIDAFGATAASDVLNEWGVGARFFISNLIVCTLPEINNGFPI